MDNVMQPKMTITTDGDTFWRLPCGDLHRTDGPAIEWANGDKEWWKFNNFHRADGPALEYVDGARSWWLNGTRQSFDNWLKRTTGLTDEEKVMLKLEYG
jgi:hypothetical protein